MPGKHKHEMKHQEGKKRFKRQMVTSVGDGLLMKASDTETHVNALPASLQCNAVITKLWEGKEGTSLSSLMISGGECWF